MAHDETRKLLAHVATRLGGVEALAARLGIGARVLGAYLSGKVTWAAFAREYRNELFAPAGVDAGNRTIKNHGQKFTLRLLKALARRGNVTLMCHCAEDEMHCHRHVLQRLILGKAV